MDSRTYKHVNSLERGLTVLEALNSHRAASISELSKMTGIHRTTIYRLLDTLQSLGYVRCSPSDNTYRLALKVRALSEGFDDEAWVSEIASPILGQLFREVLWPTNIATFDETAMVIRETTHRFSPFSIHHSMVGKHLPVLTTALGRAYLAFSSPTEREIALAGVINAGGDQADKLRNKEWLERILERTRARGYGVNIGETDEKIASFALPIRWNDRVLACLNIVFFSTAMKMDAAVARYMGPMREAVDSIEKALHQHRFEFVGRELRTLAEKNSD